MISSPTRNHSAIRFLRASQLPSRPISWLWPGRLALGKLSMLEGDPDQGKSLVATDLCARITTGRPFPDGCPSLGPRNVIFLDAEDNKNDTILPRLRAAGADMNR